MFNRISAQSKLDSDLMVQNERIGKASRPTFENIVIPFKTQDEELIREYNAQFPTSFETGEVDEKGNKVFKKYIMPQNEPDLVEPENLVENMPSDEDINKLEQIRVLLVNDIEEIKLKIKKASKEITYAIKKVDD